MIIGGIRTPRHWLVSRTEPQRPSAQATRKGTTRQASATPTLSHGYRGRAIQVSNNDDGGRMLHPPPRAFARQCPGRAEACHSASRALSQALDGPLPRGPVTIVLPATRSSPASGPWPKRGLCLGFRRENPGGQVQPPTAPVRIHELQISRARPHQSAKRRGAGFEQEIGRQATQRESGNTRSSFRHAPPARLQVGKRTPVR